MVFAQYGIPVISDMTPSACSLIDNGVSGYLAHYTKSWYYSMKTLAENIQLRNSMGQILKDKYYSIACPKVQIKIL